MICGNCRRPHQGKIGFGSICEGCSAWLHVCVNCSLYNPDARRCRSRTTDYTGPGDAKNFCEEFTPVSGDTRESREDSDPVRRFDRLFGDGNH